MRFCPFAHVQIFCLRNNVAELRRIVYKKRFQKDLVRFSAIVVVF